MRYHYKKPEYYRAIYGKIYNQNHPVFHQCTLYLIGTKGLGVIQQRYDPINKTTWWTEIDPWLVDELYLHPKFKEFFDKRSKDCKDGCYPVVTIRQIMWALKMKPLKRERWETSFDRREV